jgi:5'-deoxynucleotidase YfbR-like HD superfamily hydrolase
MTDADRLAAQRDLIHEATLPYRTDAAGLRERLRRCEARLREVEAERDEIRLDRDERESRRIDAEYDLVITLSAAEADAARLADRVEALEQLAACLRIEKRPPESLFRRLDATAEAARLHDERVTK